jgi:hypothetical protein
VKGRALGARPFQPGLIRPSLEAGALQHRAHPVPVERHSAGDQVDPGEPGRVGVHVGDLIGQIADAVRARQRRELNGAQDPDHPSGRVHEPAAGVARDTGADGVDVMAPATAGVLDDDAMLRAQRGHAAPQLGVAVGVDGGSGAAPAADARWPTQRRHRRIDVRHVRRVQLDQGEVVERTGVRVSLFLCSPWRARATTRS